jgi:hypothetical protein
MLLKRDLMESGEYSPEVSFGSNPEKLNLFSQGSKSQVVSSGYPGGGSEVKARWSARLPAGRQGRIVLYHQKPEGRRLGNEINIPVGRPSVLTKSKKMHPVKIFLLCSSFPDRRTLYEWFITEPTIRNKCPAGSNSCTQKRMWRPIR